MTEIRTGIKLTGDASGLNAEFVKAEKAAGSLNTAVASVNKGTEQLGKAAATTAPQLTAIAGAVKQVVSAAALWQLGKQAISTSDDMTILHSRLKLVTSGAMELGYVQARLFGIAQQSRVDFAELGATYAQIARASAELGVSQERMLGVTQSIGQAMAISGGSAESMKAALVQLSQGLASGTLRGEELNSVMEQTPRLAQAIAQGMGVSLGQLRALGQDGKLTALGVIEALEKAAPALRREFEQVTPTIAQTFTTLKNSSSLFTEQLDRATGSSTTLKTAISTLVGVIDALTERIKLVNSESNDATDQFLKFEQGAKALAIILETVVVLGANVAYVIKQTGNELGGLAAQGAAILKGDFAGAGAIRAAMLDDAARARAGVDRFSAGVLGKGGSARQAPTGSLADIRRSELEAQTKAEQAVPFPGAKPIEEVRKYGKLALDVQREAYDQSVDAAKSFQNRIALASNDADKVALTKEMNAKLIQIDKEAKREIQSIAEQGASDAKTLSEAKFSVQKAALEKSAALERGTLDQRSRSNEQFYRLGLVNVDEYYTRKAALEVEALEISERLTRAELEQAKATTAKAQKQSDQLQAKARELGLERELIDLATRKRAIQAEPEDQRALRLKEFNDGVRDGVRNDRVRSRDLGYDLSREMEEETRRMGVDAIKDPYARGRAQLEEELRRRKDLIDSIIDPDARELAEQRFNDFAVAKHDELAERMKPGFQQLLDAWNDTGRLIRESYNDTMESIVTNGEDAFVRSKGNLVTTTKSMVDELERELYRLAYRKYLAGAVSSAADSVLGAIGSIFGGGTGVNAPDDGTFNILEDNRLQRRASGGSYGAGWVLRGEKGPELSYENSAGYVFNASQTKDILAGNRGGGTSGVQVVLNITNNSNAQVQQTGQRQRGDGSVEIDIMVKAVEDSIADRVSSGRGPLAGALEGRYGMKAQVS